MSEKTIRKCSACGTSPINHKLLFTINLIDEITERLGNILCNKFSCSPTTKKSKEWRNLASLVEKIVFTSMSYVGIVGFNYDMEKAVTGRSKLIWEEAEKRGIAMSQLKMFGKPVELYRARINDNRTSYFYFKSLPIPTHLEQSGYDWLDDKFILFKKLTDNIQNNIPVPKTKKILSWKNAVDSFRELSKPIILKPQHGSRGRHTTTNINTEKELRDAFDLGREITLSMILQEHLHGSVYRATVINNELVGFFRGDLPEIIGDGKKNIREQISDKNKIRHERVSEISINDDLVNFIKRQGYTTESILSKNATLALSAKTGRMYGSYTREMLPEVHPKMHAIFKKAGEIVSAPVVGFDLIIEDPTKDPDLQKWGIIECNSLPFIDLHYFALEGPKINLAENVWDLWEKTF